MSEKAGCSRSLTMSTADKAEKSDEDSDVEQEDGEEEKEGYTSSYSLTSASDDDADKRKCPICLYKFRNQEIATPDSCAHTFCFTCISEWSKNTNTCPIDRQNFYFILVKTLNDDRVIRKVAVKDRDYDSDVIADDDEDRTFCEVCGNANREDHLLLCDGCDKGFHLECLNPPLAVVPIEEWFCDTCTARFQRRQRTVDGEIDARRRRAIPRTRATERVRNRIANHLVPFIVESSDENDLSDDESVVYQLASDNERPTTSTAAKPKRVVKRRRRRRRHKVKRISSSSQPSYGKKIKRRRRRRYKRRRVGTGRRLRRTLSDSNIKELVDRIADGTHRIGTVKSRLAEHLGIVPAKKEFLLPSIKPKPIAPGGFDVGSGGGASSSTFGTFSLFGNHNELMDFDDEEETSFDAGLSDKARRFNRPLSAVIRANKRCDEKSVVKQLEKENIKEESKPKPDLLDSILQGQDLLYGKTENLVIKRDGSLSAKKTTSASEISMQKIETVSDSKKDFQKPTTILTASAPENAEKSFPGRKSSFSPPVDEASRRTSLDARIKAIAATNRVAPHQLPSSVASQLGICGEVQYRKKGPLLPHPLTPLSSTTNQTMTDVVTNVLNVPPPPPPPSMNANTSYAARHAPSISNRNMPKMKNEQPKLSLVTSNQCQPQQPMRFSPITMQQNNAILSNMHIPPPPPPASIIPQGNTYAAPTAFFSADGRRHALPVRLPLTFPSGDVNQQAILLPGSASESFLMGQHFGQALSPFRFPTGALGLPAAQAAMLHCAQFPQIPLSMLQQIQQAQRAGVRPNLFLHQMANAGEFGPFGAQQDLQSSLVANPFSLDAQALTGSGLVSHHVSALFRDNDEYLPATPDVKVTPISMPLPPEEPTAPTPPASSSAIKMDLKDPTIPNELLGLLHQFAQMKNDQKSLAAAKSSSLFPHSNVKETKGYALRSPIDDDHHMQIDDSPFSAVTPSSGDMSPDLLPSAVPKPTRTVQFHPEVEAKSTPQRLSKVELRQKKTEQKLRNLLTRASSSALNNSSSNDDDMPTSAVDQKRREKLLAKFNYQLRVEEEVKIALKPYYSKKRITKEQYKNVMRKTVPKICKKKAEINPQKIHAFVESYIQKILGANVKGKRSKSKGDDDE